MLPLLWLLHHLRRKAGEAQAAYAGCQVKAWMQSIACLIVCDTYHDMQGFFCVWVLSG
jgi:hypothetical protein